MSQTVRSALWRVFSTALGGLLLWYLLCAVIELLMVASVGGLGQLVPTEPVGWLYLFVVPVVFGLSFPPMWILLPVCQAISLVIVISRSGPRTNQHSGPSSF